MRKKGNIGAVLLVLLGAASYGVVSSIFKLAIRDGWGIRELTFLQGLTGTVLIWLLLLASRKARTALRMRRSVWLQLALIGVVGIALTTLLLNYTLSRMDASLSIVLLFQYAWITILLESIRARRWPARNQWSALLLIFMGTFLAVGILERQPGAWDPAALWTGSLAAVAYSLFFFLAGFLPPKLESTAKSAVMTTAALLFVLLVQGTGTFASSGGGVPLIVWGLLLGMFGTVLPTLLFNFGIPRIGGDLAAILGALELPVAIVAAYVLLGEPLSWWQGAGVLLILLGIGAAQRREGRSAAVRPGSEERR